MCNCDTQNNRQLRPRFRVRWVLELFPCERRVKHVIPLWLGPTQFTAECSQPLSIDKLN